MNSPSPTASSRVYARKNDPTHAIPFTRKGKGDFLGEWFAVSRLELGVSVTDRYSPKDFGEYQK